MIPLQDFAITFCYMCCSEGLSLVQMELQGWLKFIAMQTVSFQAAAGRCIFELGERFPFKL